MAEKRKNTTSTSGNLTNTFTKGLVKDYDDSYVGSGIWTHARNAVNNSHNGLLGTIQNEPSNLECLKLPYKLNGLIHLEQDRWAVFSTDDINSEIGIFSEESCSYRKVVNSTCLGFNSSHMITGYAKKNYDQTTSVYFDNGLNPSRTLNLDNPPYYCKKIQVEATDEYQEYNTVNEDNSDNYSGCTHVKLYAGSCGSSNASTFINYINCYKQAITLVINPGESTDFWVKDMEDITVNFNCEDPGVTKTAPMMRVLEVIPANPFEESVTSKKNVCYRLECTTQLNCEKLRLSNLISTPCAVLKPSTVPGTLSNGTYQVVGAYTINEIRVSDFFTPSNPVSLFSHENFSGALEVEFTNLDQSFSEFELSIISVVNQQTVVKRLGTYSTNQKTISISNIDPTLTTIPLKLLPIRNMAIEKSDAMYSVNDYLLRIGVYSKPEINYQLQANKIVTKWQAVQYPADYYKNGTNISNMRDEVVAYFIRWVYNTGDKTASYHIPGRAALSSDTVLVSSADTLDPSSKRWQVENTATVTALPNKTLTDGGILLSEGLMSYWESTESYPDNKPSVWGTLCGKNIRHHKFPDHSTHPTTHHHDQGGRHIVVMGVAFEGITHPVDLEGNPIQNIVGYEILRGSREGNKSIIAKGIINNMREYTIPGTSQKGLYQNYPYNDLRPDKFLTDSEHLYDGSGDDDQSRPLTAYRKDIFSFHSPDTTFNKPFLSSVELKVYQELTGTALGRFEEPYKHPKFKILTDGAYGLAAAIGGIMAVQTMLGKGGLRTEATADRPVSIGAGGGTGGGFPGSDLLGISGAVGWVLKVTEIIADIISVVVMIKAIGNEALKIVKSYANSAQYAVQYNSHGFYDSYVYRDNSVTGNRRRKIKTSKYIQGQLQELNGTYKINNLFRPGYVCLELDKELQDPTTKDTSRRLLSDSDTPKKKNIDFSSTISTQYAAIKVNLPAQYGQIESIKQIPVSNCVYPTKPVKDQKYKTGTLFGGDVYISRYTEKNPFFYFNDWLIDVPEDFEYDYRLNTNVAYPRYWVENQDESMEDIQVGMNGVKVDENSKRPKVNLKLRKHFTIRAATNFRHLNRYGKNGVVQLKGACFYLFNNGTRDFFVESEINLTHRDWEDTVGKRHYDYQEFTDLSLMYRSDKIKENNFYKYDYSLSVGRLYQNYTTWGNVVSRDYDPELAVTAFSYYPNRVQYSLQQQDEQKNDNWKVFLVNNYKDLPGEVTSIKSIEKTGALIMMRNQSPMKFTGVETLQTDAGTKVTIGDGGLFARPLENIVNADSSYEYGSSQSRLGAVGTPHGVFWISQDQGKIFSYTGSINDITRDGNKWWFAKYLPSQLLKDFPEFELRDNPVNGVGCQAIYDNTNEVIYFAKKDYKLRDEYKNLLVYQAGNRFTVEGQTVLLGDSNYFQDASWTMSYDPKSKVWLSHHDWHPDLMLPGKNHFLTIKDGGIWKHNIRCDSYCNFYGKDYPFEVEFVASSGQQVNTLRSVEYQLECFTYHNDCRDKFHVLDENFDRAIVHNSDQISGLLKLNPAPKNDPLSLINYPILGVNGTDILVSKEEQKYRFNQFWDVTRDRGEFSGRQIPIFVTEPNGYVTSINRQAVNYNKPALQLKKFRHVNNRVFLRKIKSGNTQMIFKVFNMKTLESPR